MEASARVHFVDGADVDAFLGTGGRVYLAGHLGRPQEGFAHVGSLEEPTEVGITRYEKLTVDQPHLHTFNVDFTYVVEGSFTVRIIPTGEVRELRKNGLCVIEPGLAHVCVAQPGTQVLFVKIPGGNDKVPAELDDDARAWVAQMTERA